MSEPLDPRDAATADDDDVAGHLSPRPTGDLDPLTDDVEGRRFPAGSAGQQPAADDEDDVTGHGWLRPTDPKQ
jgi:hypothetical protein